MKTLEDIQKLLNVLNGFPFETMEVTFEGLSVKVSRGCGAPASAVRVTEEKAAPSPKAIPPASQGEQSGAVAVASPIIGVFYAAPSPEDAPFVQVGDVVKSGQTLCIVEAMKLMNEIPSPVTGKLIKVVAGDGAEVEVGQTLFLVEPSEG